VSCRRFVPRNKRNVMQHVHEKTMPVAARRPVSYRRSSAVHMPFAKRTQFPVTDSAFFSFAPCVVAQTSFCSGRKLMKPIGELN
jgi:hypothetical protein